MLYLDSNSLNMTLLFQGDIIDNFPFFLFDEIKYIKKADTGGDKYEIIDGPTKSMLADDKILALTKITMSKIAILSHTCDAQRRENIIVAPVFPISDKYEKQKDALKKNKINYWFYLPKNNDALKEDCLIDFQFMYYLPQQFVENRKNNKILSLSDFGIQELDWALSQYLSRPISEKHIGVCN